MSPWLLLISVVLYILCFIGISLWGDSRTGRQLTKPIRPFIYSLSLAVYCSGWTFYSTVTASTNDELAFIPLYLGPALMFLFGHPILSKIVTVAKKQNTTSIADFLSSRYSKKRGIALLTTLICSVAVIPYIASQLTVVTQSIRLLSSAQHLNDSNFLNLAVITLITLFSIILVTRKIETHRYRHGLMLAVSLNSLIKLGALIILAIYIVFVFYAQPSQFTNDLVSYQILSRQDIDSGFITQIIVSAGAILVFPKQFHVSAVECNSHRNLRSARWLFPLYLLVVGLTILPIAAAHNRIFHEGLGMTAEAFMLFVPHIGDHMWLTVLMFIGVFSASLVMVVLATFTLSTMITNDALLPTMLKGRLSRDKHFFGTKILMTRRVVILFIVLLAWLYNLSFNQDGDLTTNGLIAFSLIFQVVPAMLFGLYWRKANAFGAYAGMIGGCLVWFWTLMVPILIGHGWLAETLLTNGPFSINWLRPEHLFGSRFEDPLTHCIFFSLLANCFLLFQISSVTKTTLTGRLQAAAFILPSHHSHDTRYQKPNIKTNELVNLLARFSGDAQVKNWLTDYELAHNIHVLNNAEPSIDFIRFVERKLAGIVGANSARAMLQSTLSGRDMYLEEVVSFFDATSKAIHFNQQVLSSTLENIDSGVAVMDRHLKLAAWNKTYLEMYPYPTEKLKVGTAAEDLIRHHLINSDFHGADIEDEINKRLKYLSTGSAFNFIRVRKNGQVLDMRGNPIPDGGLVITFSDITEHVQTQEALKQSKQNLEQRVAERTAQIDQMNKDLRAEIKERERAQTLLLEAKNEAEQANKSKSRFLALASHDILQPLNAARLYSAALHENYSEDATLTKLESALRSTEELISTLLEIAKLDGISKDALKENVELNSLFNSIADEFSAQAKNKGLRLIVRPNNYFVKSEARSLRRVIQNLVSNAIKYTRNGGVLLVARKRQGGIVIQVWDSGLGIAEEDIKQIFEDFQRLDQHHHEAEGVGLGLAVVSRISQHLNHPIEVKSKVNKGSMFEISVPESTATNSPLPAEVVHTAHQLALNILVVDDDSRNIDALKTLLTGWGCQVSTALSAQQAFDQSEAPDLLIIDYDLTKDKRDKQNNGLALYSELQQHWQGKKVPAILVTAHPDLAIKQAAEEQNIGYLSKPIKAIALRAMINASVYGR
ncbi:PAS domain-containing hybrid sensor histidine kinase/response regulator [Reinekea thalattae]|uniref:histidine kinase n=1 Tax=Reinekea thalattae TaxID=2593301 RepID=A0A5C8ZDG8_9GAMM|nr:PAS-domain containing protein [Reinekea thalattae]TXR54840.1 response regulator [Reinekea thalattae]